ncbi:DNA polymerase III subunit gamma and tau [Nocardia cyriacigeorgica]|uniref:DNA polymerase III subunit gamma and tau n=1 Tax=Nocardia cyriacigeorgica TaxID=135487 RepID=UPI0018942E46|nr:DNA polymerase III subunit gamma and tau [Nocardia cyriacigeorgica]MBF6102047.1 DNA polymerase III subunit gamma and tau [Nocardia cyriacigeorgica]MBF6315272.1 DNA polymerase III subunit gamma and tau [Nocardia cyriacigeorgica]MBF6530058.1 DNA polymerase III subunit gamma and tau [Nocardia cyriacigeorgica]
MALYRKYRPASFAEVVGQEHVTDPLSTALDTGRISHAYLFSGPRGCGKTSSARILARSLNCAEGPTSRPCGVCQSCVALAPGGPGNLDVIELDAASHGGVDDTRELRDRAFYAPAESRYRVFIVDEAHMVTTAGFNALLKIVEEPPAHLIFIFATTEPDKVLPTIRSRTHHYPFRLLPPATMRGLLGRICEQENVPVEEAVYPLVIRAGGGSPRDSLSVLDQLLAGAGPEGVTYPRAVSLLGVTDVALIDDAVEALAGSDGAALFGTIDRVMEAGHDPRRFSVDLLERLRDLILLRAVPDAAERGLVAAPGDQRERMHAQAESLGPAALTRYAELLHAGLGEMRGATAPRLLLEVICARMLLPAATDSDAAALQRLETLERQFAAGAVPSAAGTASAAAPAVAPAPPPADPNRRRGAEALAALRESRAPKRETDQPGAAPGQPEATDRPVTQQPQPAAAARPAAEQARTATDQAVRQQPPAGPESAPEGQPEAGHLPEPQTMTTEARADQTPAPSTGQPRDEQAVPDHDAGIGSGEVPPDSIAARGTGIKPAVRPRGEPDTGRDQQPRPAASISEGHQAEDHTGGDAPPHPMSAPTHPVTEPSTAATSTAEPVPAAARDENVEQETASVDSAPEAVSAPPAVGDPLAELEAAWADIKAEVRKIAIAVHAMLTAAAPARVDGDTAVFVHPHDALVKRLSEQRSVDALRTALQTVLGREFDVRFEAGAAQTAPRGGPGTRGRGGRESGGAGSRRSGDGAAEDPAPGAYEPSAPRSFSRPSAAASGAAGDAPSPAEPAHPEPTTSRPANARSASTPPRFSRPSQAKAAPIADEDIPPPDYPDLPDDPGPGEYSSAPIPPPTPEEEQEMLAESARPVAPGDRQDPDEVALQLLASELGAVRLE